jgi:Concanavalin A-like lectin/glucanases superfamily/Chitobiase/beta-hexosaminidase C-terminal domain/Domain of unknown function (DUF2341)
MSPAQVAISQPLSSGKDNGGENGKAKVHRKLPDLAGAVSPSDGALQTSLGPFINATGGTHFDGVGANGSAPPDTNMAVGQNPAYNYILQTVNSRYAVYTKSGALVVGPYSLSSIWAPLGRGNGCATNNAGDVVAQYDKLADRWMVTQLGGVSSPFSECIAISTTADPTGTYYLYSFSYGTTLNDYPKFGVWPTATNGAYLAHYNLFANGNSFIGGQVCAYDRTKMLAGDPTAQAICYSLPDGGYLPSDLDGSTPPLDGTPGYFLNFETSSSLRLYALAPNFANPALSTLTQITPDLSVTAFSEACGGGTCVPQSGTNQKLDSLGDRLMYRLAFRNFGDHEAMVVNHSVATGSTVGERWYELRSPVSTKAAFSIYQQSTFSPDSTYRWMGSAAMDGAGDIALGYSVSSSSINPGIRYTGRVPGDALGTMETEATILSGTGSQTNGLTRWGDYSAMRIDPADDCTFWYTNEYLPSNGSFNWKTHIGSFKFSSCGGQVATPTFNPPAGTYSSAQPVTISTTTVGASIRYTTDGSTPSSTVGMVYVSPVMVSSSLTLKAIAYETGMTDSLVASAAYTINTGGPGWYSNSWTNRKAITIDHTKVSGSSSLGNFAVLFSATDANLKTVANGGNVGKSDGTDILFTAGDGTTKLDHELERYNALTGEVIAWVRVPSLSNTTDTVLYIYYGNAAAANQQNPTGVWDSSYKGIWHLPNGTILNGSDSTANANNGSIIGASAGSGEIDGAGSFSGSSQYINISNFAITDPYNFTLEAWINPTDYANYDGIVGKTNSNLPGPFDLYLNQGNGKPVFYIGDGGSHLGTLTGTSAPGTAAWSHIVVVSSGSFASVTLTQYLNGATNGATTFTSFTAADTNNSIKIASRNDLFTMFKGGIDEVRISSTPRSAGWIATEYSNQNSPSTFFAIGAQE